MSAESGSLRDHESRLRGELRGHRCRVLKDPRQVGPCGTVHGRELQSDLVERPRARQELAAHDPHWDLELRTGEETKLPRSRRGNGLFGVDQGPAEGQIHDLGIGGLDAREELPGGPVSLRASIDTIHLQERNPITREIYRAARAWRNSVIQSSGIGTSSAAPEASATRT